MSENTPQDIKKLAAKIMLFLLFQISIFFTYYHYQRTSWRAFLNAGLQTGSRTTSSLASMPQAAEVPWVFFGASRGAALSAKETHSHIEDRIGQKILNLSRGGGGGLIPAKILWETLESKKNHVSNVVYFLDPFILYASTWNEEHTFMLDEPLDLFLLFKLLNNKVKLSRVFRYLRDPALSFTRTIPEQNKNDSFVEIVDPEAIRKRNNIIYSNGLNIETFEKYSSILLKMIQNISEQGTKVYIVFLPTLLGYEQGFEQTKTYIESNIGTQINVRCLDFVNYFEKDGHYFVDHDHLNDKGATRFFESGFIPQLNVPHSGKCITIDRAQPLKD